MKKFTLILGLALLTSSSFAGELDGLKFCRSVKTGGMFGQPVGVRKHCVEFNNDILKDNANTFFGNPPVSYKYKVKNEKVLKANGTKTGYIIVDGNLVIAETKAVLERQ